MIAILPALEGLPEFAALFVLALLQGLTEFLPVSSSGHLVLAQAGMGLEEPALTIDIALHLGTLGAVFVVYRQDLLGLVSDLFARRLREIGLLAVGSVPAGVVGLVFQERLRAVFEQPDLAAGGLFVTALILVVGEVYQQRRPVEPQAEVDRRPLTVLDAFLIGCAQALAIWPGISRSGSTIAMGMVRGLSPERAARFSFLLAIPAILGAAVLNMDEAAEHGGGSGVGLLLWAALFAGFVGWGALRLLIAFLGRGAFAWFAVYCVTLGAGYLIFL